MRYSSSLPFFFEDPGESFEENHLSERNSYRTATLIHYDSEGSHRAVFVIEANRFA